MSDSTISINLSKQEAWVLFDLVGRFSETDKLKIEHQSEERALWNLCCIFERTLTLSEEDGNYEAFMKKCREELEDEETKV